MKSDWLVVEFMVDLSRPCDACGKTWAADNILDQSVRFTSSTVQFNFQLGKMKKS
jgi:hypothetical protein